MKPGRFRSRYTQTFLWLQCHDEGLLTAPDGQSGADLPTVKEVRSGLAELKQAFARSRKEVWSPACCPVLCVVQPPPPFQV
jgi:hypothetical protein